MVTIPLFAIDTDDFAKNPVMKWMQNEILKSHVNVGGQECGRISLHCVVREASTFVFVPLIVPSSIQERTEAVLLLF